MSQPLRVLVVDDAAFMRATLVKLLRQGSDIEVVGEARNGREAIGIFNTTRPDVVCLDIDMPEMDGITALKHFMATRPTPVVVVSSMTDRQNVPFELFRLGVIDFFPKPSSLVGAVEEQTRLLLYVLRNAKHIRIENLTRVPLRPANGGERAPSRPRQVLVIAGALGSVGALVRFLALIQGQASDLALVCMVPIHEAIRSSFEESIGRLFGWQTEWVEDTLALEAGRVCLLRPGTRVSFGPETVRRSEGASVGPLDGLFAAAGEGLADRATIVLLAGSDCDGIAGLTAAHKTGARCFVQDPRTALFATWHPDVPAGVDVLSLESVVALIVGGEPKAVPGSE